jgi:hypothetical protein
MAGITGSFYIKGVKELDAQMNKMMKEMTAGEAKILLDGAKYIQAGVDQNIAGLGKVTGLLAKSTYSIAYPATTTLPARAFTGIRPKVAPHAHLVEYGHNRTKVKKGPVLGFVPPHPFFRPAIDTRSGPALDMVEAALGRKIDSSL